jgi:hypothetical protein
LQQEKEATEAKAQKEKEEVRLKLRNYASIIFFKYISTQKAKEKRDKEEAERNAKSEKLAKEKEAAEAKAKNDEVYLVRMIRYADLFNFFLTFQADQKAKDIEAKEKLAKEKEAAESKAKAEKEKREKDEVSNCNYCMHVTNLNVRFFTGRPKSKIAEGEAAKRGGRKNS